MRLSPAVALCLVLASVLGVVAVSARAQDDGVDPSAQVRLLQEQVASLRADVDFLRARAAHVIAAEEQKILRKIEGIGKWIDVKRFLTGLRVEDPSAGPIVARAGLGGSLVTVLVDVAITNAGAVKAHEVAEVLLGEGARDTPYAVVRAAMGGLIDGALVSPLELERFRKAPPAREPLGAPAAPTALET